MFIYIRDIVVFLQPFIVFITGCITIYFLLRTRPSKLQKIALSKKSIVINWSGHPLTKEPWLEEKRIWTPLQSPHFDTESWETLRKSATKLIKEIPKDIQARILRGDPDIVFVVPQLAAGLSVLMAILHGTIGGFPTITCPLRTKDGSFTLPEPINLSELRLRSKNVRDMLSF